jgi:predicted dehydrogenase
MPACIRVGIVSTSWYAEEMHIANLIDHPGVDLCAIYGRNRSHADELADRYTIPQVYTD